MANTDTTSMALFCDFENVALGVRDAKYEKFDIKKILERLLLKGSIVVKKAYCDWERYKSFKAPMHEASFELIEIPHVRQSGKNSADIRMVVDALDLCYTKSHVDTFVLITGDSDFSPLVSKLRENNKTVIGVGVKKSTSDLLIANCDEFIYYDDLVREKPKKQAATRRKPAPKAAPKNGSSEPATEVDTDRPQRTEDEKRQEALDIVMETVEALFEERGAEDKIWGSMVKQALKRRNPGFNESYYGFGSFSKLLDEAESRKLVELEHDEKSGGVIIRGFNTDWSRRLSPREIRPLRQRLQAPPGDDASHDDVDLLDHAGAAGLREIHRTRTHLTQRLVVRVAQRERRRDRIHLQSAEPGIGKTGQRAAVVARLPETEQREHRVAGIDPTVAVAVEQSQLRKTVARRRTEQLRAGIDARVAVAVVREQHRRACGRRNRIGSAVVVQIEPEPRIHHPCRPTVQIQHQRILRPRRSGRHHHSRLRSKSAFHDEAHVERDLAPVLGLHGTPRLERRALRLRHAFDPFVFETGSAALRSGLHVRAVGTTARTVVPIHAEELDLAAEHVLDDRLQEAEVGRDAVVLVDCALRTHLGRRRRCGHRPTRIDPQRLRHLTSLERVVFGGRLDGRLTDDHGSGAMPSMPSYRQHPRNLDRRLSDRARHRPVPSDPPAVRGA
jgi:uncharacterized protein (TIGR00288 family)